MEITDKKIAFLGDSITEGVGVSDPAHIYWRRIADRTGARSYGYGIGGTRIAPQHTPSEQPAWDRYFGSRVADMIPDADIVVVFGGTNDFGHGDAALGDPRAPQPDTFCGALHQLLRDLIERYPAAQLVVMTPLHRLTEDRNAPYNERGIRNEHTLEDYVDAIATVAAYYGIPVLDLFRTSGLQPAVPAVMARYMPDGLHPNDEGHARIAERLIGFLAAL